MAAAAVAAVVVAVFAVAAAAAASHDYVATGTFVDAVFDDDDDDDVAGGEGVENCAADAAFADENSDGGVVVDGASKYADVLDAVVDVDVVVAVAGDVDGCDFVASVSEKTFENGNCVVVDFGCGVAVAVLKLHCRMEGVGYRSCSS